MADILCLKGDAAFSAFRLQRLTSRLTAAVPDIESVVADYWHVVAQKRVLDADERAKLATLLEEQAAGAEAGELFLVAPRIGTISPWSSKATDIAFNCDLAPAIERIERVVAFHVAGLLHDRMTESVLSDFAKPRRTVPPFRTQAAG
jgi:phosphoribosylformylglycinamidine synthase